MPGQIALGDDLAGSKCGDQHLTETPCLGPAAANSI